MKIEIKKYLISGDALEENIVIATKDMNNFIMVGKKIDNLFEATIIKGSILENQQYTTIGFDYKSKYVEL